METIIEQRELDPRKKDGIWAERVISDYRYHWQPLVDPEKAKTNMQYLLNQQGNEQVRSMFKNPDSTKLSFKTLAVIEKYRNILTAERDKAGIYISLNAIDPTVVDEKRKRDRDLLSNRKNIEGLLSTLNAKLGEPPYKIQNEKFHGNIESFDEIGLNSEDDEDLNYFFSTFWRLNLEIKAEIPINYFFKLNEVKKIISDWCNDILSKKAIAMTTYVNEITGAIEMKYLPPETVYGVWGERKDGKDAKCKGYHKNVTVEQYIRHLGNEFNPARDFLEILNTINSRFGKSYTALQNRTGHFILKDSSKQPEEQVICGWSEFMTYKVPIGYIEFKSIDANTYKVGYSVHGNYKRLPIAFDSEIRENSNYAKEALYNEVTYKAYFLATSDYTQRIYKFGKLYHQAVQGGEDEYSNFSIMTIKEGGPSAIEVIMPYVDMIQQAWTKFEWFVRKAKPSGRVYSYESLVTIANKMFNTGTEGGNVEKMMALFEEGVNEIYSTTIQEKANLGGGGNPYYEKKAGLDQSAKDFSETILLCHEKISNDLGINSIREAYSPSPNDGYKLHMATLQQSRNATEYMSTMILNLTEHAAIQTLIFCNDIIKFKTSIPYKFLVKAVGIDTVKAIENANIALHRLGIFVESFNTETERQEQIQFATQAFLAKEIDYATLQLIKSIDSYKKIGQVLAFEKKKAEKQRLAQEQMQHDRAMELERLKSENILRQDAQKGMLDIKKEDVAGLWYFKAHQATADATVEAKKIGVDGQKELADIKKDGKIEENRDKKKTEKESKSLLD